MFANQTHGAGFTLQCSLPKKLQTLVLRRQSGVFKRPKVPKPRRQMGSLVVRMTKNHPNISKVHENLWLRHFDVKEPLLRSFRRPSAVKYRKPRRVASGRNLLDLGGQGLANLMGILNALYLLNIRKYHLKYQEPCGKWEMDHYVLTMSKTAFQTMFHRTNQDTWHSRLRMQNIWRRVINFPAT